MAAPELILSGRAPSAVVGVLGTSELLLPVRGDSLISFPTLLHAAAALETSLDGFQVVLHAYVAGLPEPSRPRVPIAVMQTERGKLRHPDVDAWKIEALLASGMLNTSSPGWNCFYSVLEAGPGDEVHTLQLAEKLLDAGANPCLPSPARMSPLHLLCGEKFASTNCDALVMKLLTKVDVNTRDSSGATPLLDAARYSSPEVVALLLSAGSDVNALDEGGESALCRVLRCAPSVTPSRFIKKLDAIMGAGFNVMTASESGPAIVAVMQTLARMMTSATTMAKLPAKSAARIQALYAQLEPIAMPYLPTHGGAAAQAASGDDVEMKH